MRTEKEIKELYNIFGYFNDGKIMEQKYRQGVLDALSFVIYHGHPTYLSRFKEQIEKGFTNFLTAGEDKQQTDLEK